MNDHCVVNKEVIYIYIRSYHFHSSYKALMHQNENTLSPNIANNRETILMTLNMYI